MCVKHCLTCQNIQILRKQVNKHYILCASRAKLFLAGKFLTDIDFILSADRANLALGIRSRGLVKKAKLKTNFKKLLIRKNLALVVYFSENHLRSKWQQLLTRPMGSFFNYVDKTRQVCGTKNVNGNQIFPCQCQPRVGRWSIMRKIWSKQLKNDPLHYL